MEVLTALQIYEIFISLELQSSLEAKGLGDLDFLERVYKESANTGRKLTERDISIEEKTDSQTCRVALSLTNPQNQKPVRIQQPTKQS